LTLNSRVVLGTEKDSLTEELPKFTSEKISKTIEDTYNQFFSAKEKQNAAGKYILTKIVKLNSAAVGLCDYC
jgi:hypothetical protein